MTSNIYLLKEKFLQEKRKTLHASTLASYENKILLFIGFLEEKELPMDVREITRGDVRDFFIYLENYKDRRKGKNLSKHYKYGVKILICNWFEYLEETDSILTDPAKSLDIPVPPKKLPSNILTEEEVRLILESPDLKEPIGLRDRAVLEIMYGSGLRRVEICSLTLDSVDLDNGYIFIREGKGGKDRVVPLTRAAKHYLKKYLLEARPVYVAKAAGLDKVFLTNRGEGLKPSVINQLVRIYVRKSGIKNTASPHTLRHSCATHLIGRGASVRYVQELLGHEHIDTTQIYTHVIPLNLMEVYQKTHPRCQGMKRSKKQI